MNSKNPNCDNDKCVSATGQVRKLPTGGGGGNAILCKRCYQHEMQYRKERNLTLGKTEQFDLPAWNDLKKKEN